MIFCARQLQKCQEQQAAMFIFGNPKKVFWQSASSCNVRHHCLVWMSRGLHFPGRSLHDGIVDRVWHQNALIDLFYITGGLKQGCVLAPTCFTLYVAAMFNDILLDAESCG